MIFALKKAKIDKKDYCKFERNLAGKLLSNTAYTFGARKETLIIVRKRIKEKSILTINLAALLGLICVIAIVLAMVEKPSQYTQAPQNTPVGQTNTVLIDAPYINQNEKYPTGCESVSTVMALQYLNINISVEDFIDNYLKKGSAPELQESGNYLGDDPRDVFLGDPYSPDGWGCYPGAIVKALKKLKSQNDYSFKYSHLKNNSLEKLCVKYIDKGIPVIIWATQYMQPPSEGTTWQINGKKASFTWTKPMHCLLLVGYDDTYYYFNDPQTSKNTPYEKALVETAYNALGEQALVITNSGGSHPENVESA